MTSQVYDLRTGKLHAEYSSKPAEAVVAAYEQDRGNFNSWEYDTKNAQVCGHFVTCGDFTCRIDPRGDVKVYRLFGFWTASLPHSSLRLKYETYSGLVDALGVCAASGLIHESWNITPSTTKEEIMAETVTKETLKEATEKIGPATCLQCGKIMGAEIFQSPVCGKCCRANHKKVAGG